MKTSILASMVIGLGILGTACQSQDQDHPKEPTDGSTELNRVGVQATAVSKEKAQKTGADDSLKWKDSFMRKPTPSESSRIHSKVTAWKETKNAVQLLATAKNQISIGSLKAAEITLERVLSLKPENLDAKLSLASIFLRTDRADLANKVISDVSEKIGLEDDLSNTLRLKYRYLSAVIRMALKQTQSARKSLAGIIQTDKTFAPAYGALAGSYLRVDQIDTAEFVLQRGLANTKDSASLKNLQGVVYKRRGDYSRALGIFDDLILANKHFLPARINRASVYLERNDVSLAEADIKHVLEQDPKQVDALVLRAAIHTRKGRLKDARRQLEEILRRFPGHASARMNLAFLMWDGFGNLAEARRMFQEVGQLTAKSSRMHKQAKLQLRALDPHSLTPAEMPTETLLAH